MKLHRFFIAITFALFPAILEAQEIAIGSDEGKPLEERILYNHENSLHASLHTQGLGFGGRIGRIKSIEKTTYWEIEASYLKSLKQIRLVNPSLFSFSSFVFGKLNDVLVVRGGYGGTQRIYGKPYWGGVELSWIYEYGASVALLKPYYYVVAIAEYNAGTYTEVLENQKWEDTSNWIDVLGKSSFKYGLNEIKFRPGIHAKGGMSFEFGSTRTRMQAIEVGAEAEYFPQGLDIMAENPREYVFLTLYLSYHWGTRFNKY